MAAKVAVEVRGGGAAGGTAAAVFGGQAFCRVEACGRWQRCGGWNSGRASVIGAGGVYRWATDRLEVLFFFAGYWHAMAASAAAAGGGRSSQDEERLMNEAGGGD